MPNQCARPSIVHQKTGPIKDEAEVLIRELVSIRWVVRPYRLGLEPDFKAIADENLREVPAASVVDETWAMPKIRGRTRTDVLRWVGHGRGQSVSQRVYRARQATFNNAESHLPIVLPARGCGRTPC